MPDLTVATENAHPVKLHVEDYGSGRPVVLIHGWPLSSRSWEPQVGPLVDAGYRVISYDRRGFGESSKTWSGYDYDTLTSDLRSVIEQLDLRDVTLVGFSMGGGEVARYFGTHGSERIASAVLASAVPPFLYISADNPDGALDDATIAQFEDGVRQDRLAFVNDFATNFFTAGDELKVSEEQRRYAASIAALASPKGTLDCIGAFGRTDFRADLARIDVPLLVIHGDSDGIVPFEHSGKRSAQAVADSEVVLIGGAPHGCNASHAGEFNQALLRFLR